jgi:hypothetical protein
MNAGKPRNPGSETYIHLNFEVSGTRKKSEKAVLRKTASPGVVER